ncbi:Isopenicillin N-CoA epimerase [Rasamsonia emersonii CBS 393.64]|uniref:Isopenicillin N-CoA epimerase n=1 Tax=Rasamsonia emersonii (strain ATCC 16479 / CBS 393.64 / IMI 116815) TaxID=1408163 RepID=A0A0F4YUM8_RASE3|nr:Isopenicillin N-CoA epimerase [Rasamsonia emersonii CBS 393.64]KKA21800.1 Isopenicillin N-CoA epimerase [Rasamsonia emersonii CBS 393.64]
MVATDTATATSYPLSGVRVVELAGLAPGPFAGLLLADYGASVLRVDRPQGSSPIPPVAADLLTRHKTSICLDLKNLASRAVLLSLLAKADVLIDPFRPGVLERLGLSPTDVLLKQNPQLIVARMTGFRRDGKYKDMAGHDINYLAVSGVLSMLGRAGDNPYPPANILGDFAGGGAMCFLGILLALITRQRTGRGQVVEANMVDGSAYLATMPRLALHTPLWGDRRGENLLDGGVSVLHDIRDEGRGEILCGGGAGAAVLRGAAQGPRSEDGGSPGTRRQGQLARATGDIRQEVQGEDACGMGGHFRRNRRLRDAGAGAGRAGEERV